MRRFALWGHENAMVEDPNGTFVLWADIAPVLKKDRTQKTEEPVVIEHRICRHCGKEMSIPVNWNWDRVRFQCPECKFIYDEV